LECEIAERSKAEGALQAIHERNATILGSISDAFVVLDREWRYISLNTQAERYFSCRRDDLLGRSVWEVFPQLVGTPFEHEYRRAMAEDAPVQFEARSPVTGRWLEVHAYPSSDGLSVLFQDVTARRQAREELEAKEAQLRLITDAVPALISYIDLDGRYVWANDAYRSWFGEPLDSIVGRHLRDVLGTTAWQTIEPHVQTVLSGQAVRFSSGITYKTIGRRSIDVTYTPDFAADGAVRGFVALIHDATERQAMEDSLRTSEQRFRALIDNSWDGIVVVDVRGEVTFLSPSIERILGYRSDELLGKHLFYLIHPDDHPVAQSVLADVLGRPGATISRQYRFQHRDGRWRRVEGVAVNLLRDPAVQGLVCNFRDVTEQVEAQEALLASEQRFVRFMQHLPGLAWIKDAEGRYIYANEAAMRAFGRRPEELFGRTDEALFPPETAALFRDNDHQARASATGIQTVETLQQPDGTTHYSVVSKFPIPDGDGRTSLVGGMAIDITELKTAEQALLDADRRKDEFLATLAHELRNPLAPIRNAMHFLRQGSQPQEFQAAREIIDRQLAQMVRLVDDLLDVSRITRGKLQLRTARIDLAEVVANAVETSRPIIDLAGHELTIELPPEPTYLNADLTRLAQVFANLLNNSAKYTDRGGQIRLLARHEEGEVVVSVEDTGIGIAAEHLPRIFEMFSQVTPALERTQGGLGIGLSLVRKLIEMHGGTITARSQGVGQGSTFSVRLPRAAPPAAAEPAEQSIAPGKPVSTNGKPRKSVAARVLVVDDNEDAAKSASILLGTLGHEAQMAFDGTQALEAAAAFRPDVVLLDIGLPDFNGYEVARRLRGQSWGQGLTLIALTGWGQDEDKRLALEAGFDHHLTKPVEAGELQRLICGAAAVTLESR
jgi:PAS domain S-box-containing protein